MNETNSYDQNHKHKFSLFKRLGYILKCPILSANKAKELREVVDGSEKIIGRVEEAEKKVEGLHKSLKSLIKEQKQLAKEIARNNDETTRLVKADLHQLELRIEEYAQATKQMESTAANKVDSTCAQLSGLDGALSGIRDYLAKNYGILARYQEGYDFQIFKNFTKQIIRSINNLTKQIDSIPSTEDKSIIDMKEELEIARDDLFDLLYRNGIEQIAPEIGSSYDSLRKYAEVVPEKVKAVSPADDGTIAEVVSIGFLYTFDTDKERVIQAAKVKLFEL